jgi:hypothetical protein
MPGLARRGRCGRVAIAQEAAGLARFRYNNERRVVSGALLSPTKAVLPGRIPARPISSQSLNLSVCLAAKT